ncbi:MAG: hypothetical protein ACTSU2_10015 [Promethearchaeota archaeon]
MSKDPIVSIINILENNSMDYVLEQLKKKEFWEKIIPTAKKLVEIRAPNVVYAEISDEVNLGFTPFEFQIEGELVFEDKGSDEKGKIIEFYTRKNDVIEELEGRLRLRDTSNGLKLGIFIYDFVPKLQFLGNIGQNAAELILRKKLRELVDNLKKIS